jgi:hypothetical protein
MNARPQLDRLESRDAPASLVNPTTVTYTDVDFDIVTVKISKGAFVDPNVSTDDFTFTGSPVFGEKLVLLNLSNDGGAFDGASLTFTVERGPNGDGFVNVGYINSTGNDLGVVTIKGDLGRIDAGDATATKPGLKSLNVQSLGRLGFDTQTGIASLHSFILHRLGTLVVKGDIVGADVDVTGGADSKIGSVTIGGSLIGGASNFDGALLSSGGMGPVKIGHDLQGGAGVASAIIHSDGELTSITIGGSLIGGLGFGSGEIDSNSKIGPVKIGHDVRGSFGDASGIIFSSGLLGAVTIGGSLIGGAGNYATVPGTEGQIHSGGAMGAVKIAHDVQGGSGVWSGSISTNSTLASVTIGGSLVGGTNTDSGEIRSADMGAVKIGHDVKGGSNTSAGSILAGGNLAGVIVGGSLIGGSVSFSGQIASSSDMGVVKIGHDVLGGSGIDSGRIDSDGKLAGVTVGGSLIGGSNTDSGEILSSLDMGTVMIAGDLRGGSGSNSGKVLGFVVAGVTIGGSLVGGSNSFSGGIFSGHNIGPVRIGHDVLGGSGSDSGSVESSGGKIASVTIGGSLVGGTNDDTGAIEAAIGLGAVKVSHDLIGGSISGAAAIDQSGCIQSTAGRIASIAIGGSIISGIDDSSGALNASASIRAGNDIGSLTVKGSIIGNSVGDLSPVIISARGEAEQGATTDLAIGTLTIGGRVELSYILAGYNTSLAPKNADAQIGVVKVGGDWTASNLVAGAMNSISFNTQFGNANDVKISGAGTNDTVGIISKITSITIGGLVFGTPNSTSTADDFGFIAEQIGSFKEAGTTIALMLNAHNDNRPIGTTNDVNIHEI